MSSWPSAHVPANRSVTRPTTVTTTRATPDSSNRTWVRRTRYTPAVTIVAAWIRAETGVGPAIASGSQTWSGTWADFPIAPAKSSRAMAVAAPLVSVAPAVPKTSSKSSVPNFATINARPISIAVSPIRVVMNAFLAAFAFSVLSNQKPISRYEQSPTPSQPRYRTRKFSPRTSISMKNTKRFRYEKNRPYRGSPCM